MKDPRFSLARANRKTPPSAARYIESQLPDDLTHETFNPADHPGWNHPHDLTIAQSSGRTWLTERRSALLLVPSAITAGLDTNAIINPDHPDAARITLGPETPLTLDPRMFG